ncbi:cytochrome d ubiquinol oxidase subunit II [Actinomadura harenae]|uniref:Cytochrome d ubiquinol oxidase subunit II n=1 Tax=Actinomadura harenae TaxID=2483351 RepID=A0A3M2M166_9ACTN|nr:cytochrome d ubiquinol oxidase subunit II [Actinomadura harenae]RMI43454.1 cytochrome d ubiquinol oxidase subunit II [Actinomadura harenae]
MTRADLAFGLILAGLSAYLLFGGADFGAGLWHLLSRDRPGDRRVIERAVGPMWEAHHAWLALALLLAWTAFPPIFNDMVDAYRVPLVIAAAGIAARGATSALDRFGPRRTAVGRFLSRRFRIEPLLGPASLLTPFCLGAVATTIATGEASWMSVTGIYGGALTTMLCAYFAAVHLIWNARKAGDRDVLLHFQGYAIVSGVAVGLFAMPGALALGVRSPLILVSAAAGLLSIVLVVRRRYLAVRVSGAVAVVSVLWGAASMAHLDLDGALAHGSVLDAEFTALAVGATAFAVAMAWLHVLFQRQSATKA